MQGLAYSASLSSGSLRRRTRASTQLQNLVLLLATTAVAGSCTRLEPPGPGVRLLCDDDGGCPEGLFCLRDDRLERPVCYETTADCIEVDPSPRFADDGTACGNGDRLCIDAKCVAGRCGDGFVSAALGEQCDEGEKTGTPRACRTTCTLPGCGDGVVDDGEDCDDGNATSGDGCRADCGKVEQCGDAVLDQGEACDDGNDNPRDGCAGCRTQRWGVTLQVAGAVESRSALTTSMAPEGITVDPLGRIYVADVFNHVVRRINLDGTTTTIAGIGSSGFSGEGGPATSAVLYGPRGIAVDAAGRVLVADSFNYRIRRVDLDGTITTIAGTGERSFSGDGGPATSAALGVSLRGVVVDAVGRVLVVDESTNRIRRIELDGTITTIAGTGGANFSGDGGLATSATLYSPQGVAIDGSGRIVIADGLNRRVRRIGLDGTITTIAGTGALGSSGDGGPATSATLTPSGVAVDAEGRVLVVDTDNQRVRRVEHDGTITTIAGTGEDGFSGDGGPATGALLGAPTGIAVDAVGRILIADLAHGRIRRVDLDGTITTIAGTVRRVFSGDGGPATNVALSRSILPQRGIAVDADGRVLLVDNLNNRIRRVERDGTISTIAGTGDTGSPVDSGPATSAALGVPSGIAVDASGGVVFAETGIRQGNGSRIRRIDLDGTVRTIAGTGEGSFAGDGGPATSAGLNQPQGVVVDVVGRVLVADSQNHRIRRIELDGTISTIAGTGSSDFSGDDGPATSAGLNPLDVAVDADGRVLIADTGNSRIRRVELDGTISTIAGTGARGFAGDSGPATSAALASPTGIAVDAAGRVLIADLGNRRVRRVDLDGTISTIAGTGSPVFLGDGGPATAAALNGPQDIAIDADGGILIVDPPVFRRIDLDGTLTTIAGAIHPRGPGSVDRARLYASAALASLGTGALVSVGDFGRALRVDPVSVDVVVGYVGASPAAVGQARFAPLLADARGVAFDPVLSTLVITEQVTGDLRIIGLDPDDDGVIDDAARWTNASIPTDLNGPAGIVYDDVDDTFVVADEKDHCVRRIDHSGAIVATVLGRCGSPGLFPGFLSSPSHVVVSPRTGAVYVADTGNHRVLRVDGGVASVVLGDGSVSSAGEGAPARLFPVNAPRQMAMDSFGNLYVTSTTTLRLVANVDGDHDADADDRVSTIFGGGDRLNFPESDTFCLNAVAVDDDGGVYAADACQGYLLKMTPALE
jgi:cysteine-rich repeat protein